MGRSYQVSGTGLIKAKNAFDRKGWTQDDLALQAQCSRTSITNFFAGGTVDKSLFKNICNRLDLQWEEIADLESDEQPSRFSMSATQENTSEDIQGTSGNAQVLADPASTKKQEATGKAIFVLSGTIYTVDKAKLKAIETHLRLISGDASLTITNIEEGSIKITLEASLEGLERLKELFESGELDEVLGIPVENIQLVTDEASGDVKTEDDKSPPEQNDAVQKSESQNPISPTNNPISFNLVFANLIRGNLGGAFRILKSLNRANLSSANLSSANLNSANLNSANLSRANLTNANLSRANLTNANLSRANLTNANLSRANLTNANLSRANLNLANLNLANLSRANLTNANLSLAYLINANLINADLINANLINANLSRANLINANLINADLINAKLINANLSHANLSSADLSRAYLINANLINANLINADLSRANLSSADLSRADLTDADLTDADLSSADLSSADLSRAIVVNALFGATVGLTDDMKRDLERRGAIFGDRPPVLSPR